MKNLFLLVISTLLITNYQVSEASEVNWVCTKGSGFGATVVYLEDGLFSMYFSHGSFGMHTVFENEQVSELSCSGIVACERYKVNDELEFLINIIPDEDEQEGVLIGDRFGPNYTLSCSAN